MDAERPESVLVRPDDAEVLAVSVHAEHVAQLARVDELLELLDTRVVEQEVAGHEHQVAVGGERDEAVDLGRRHRRRLLDEHVLPRLQRSQREIGVRGHGRRHDHRVERLVREQLVEVGRRPCLRKTAARALDGAAVGVADPRQVRERVEVSREVGAPVAEAGHAHSRGAQSFQTLSELRPASPVALRKSTTSRASSTTRS